nr:hypothetical protein [Roseobacter litoralis]
MQEHPLPDRRLQSNLPRGGRIDLWVICLLGIDQSMQRVQDMCLRRHPSFQRQLNCTQDGAFVVV